jgi:BolA family transcriptional regulator, general stress-responsive regulator
MSRAATTSAPYRLEMLRRALVALAPVDLEVVDESHLHAGHAGALTGRGHFRVRIVSNRFAGLNSLARHRLVYSALGDLMQTDIHALSLETLTPAEAARPSADTHFTARGSHEN